MSYLSEGHSHGPNLLLLLIIGVMVWAVIIGVGYLVYLLSLAVL